MESKKSLQFLVDRKNEVKQELKDRKKWLTALNKEYWLQRTQRNEYTKQSVYEMIVVANTMIKHYEVILKEHEDMIKELWKKLDIEKRG